MIPVSKYRPFVQSSSRITRSQRTRGITNTWSLVAPNNNNTDQTVVAIDQNIGDKFGSSSISAPVDAAGWFAKSSQPIISPVYSTLPIGYTTR